MINNFQIIYISNHAWLRGLERIARVLVPVKMFFYDLYIKLAVAFYRQLPQCIGLYTLSRRL